jgi:hypothetical protein
MGRHLTFIPERYQEDQAGDKEDDASSYRERVFILYP